MAAGVLERDADQGTLELRCGRVEQRRCAAALRLPFRPPCEHRRPILRIGGGACRSTCDLGGQVLGADLGTGRQHGEAPAKIDEFADIARPRISLERGAGFRGDRLHLHAELGRRDPQIVAEQVTDILASRP